MLTAGESKAALQIVTAAAVNTVTTLLGRVSGSPEQRRALLLEGVPEVVAYYSAGSSALAADFYDDERERAAPPKLYLAEPIVIDRTEKIRRAVAWASDPLFSGDPGATSARLAEVVSLESARPFRDTVLTNRRRDPSAVGWRRVTSGGCKLCVMLASRGAVYTDQTARFATHGHCKCSAQPVFSSSDYGDEANVMQYVASRKRRTPEQQANLREYLNTNFSDFPG
jgi:hypothetical protein